MISNESINSIYLANQYVDENMGRDDIINLANLQDENNGREENKPLHGSDLFKKNHTTKN